MANLRCFGSPNIVFDHAWRPPNGWNVAYWIEAEEEGWADAWVADILTQARAGRWQCTCCRQQLASERDVNLISSVWLHREDSPDQGFIDIATYCTGCVAVHGAHLLDDCRLESVRTKTT